MTLPIIAFALAILAATFAVVALVVSARTSIRASSSYRDLRQRLLALQRGSARTSTAKLAAEVADLGGAVEKLAGSMRRQFGTVWGTLSQLDGAQTAAARAVHAEQSKPSRDELRAKYLQFSDVHKRLRPTNGGDND